MTPARLINVLYEGFDYKKLAHTYTGNPGVPGFDPKAEGAELIRKVRVGGHIIELYELYPEDYPEYANSGTDYVGYRLLDPQGHVVFQGNDLSPSPGSSIDSDETLRTLLSFLTLRDGDTDADYFKDYTPAQLKWRDEHAEHLGIYATDPDDYSEEDEDSGFVEVENEY